MAPRIAKRYVDLPDGQVHVRSLDGPGTPMVFLHQTASSGRMWEAVMARLAGRHAMVALDTPGFGGSFDPDGMPSMPQYADWLWQAITALGLGPVHVLGHHTGACLAAEMATSHADQVASVSMIGPVPLSAEEREEFRTHFSTPMRPDARGDYLQTTWTYLAGLGADSEVALHHRELLDTARAWHGRYQAYSAVWDQDFTALYAAITCPLLIMCAPGDVLIAYFERAKALRPDARAVLLEGSNFEPDQDPDGTARALATFIDSLPA